MTRGPQGRAAACASLNNSCGKTVRMYKKVRRLSVHSFGTLPRAPVVPSSCLCVVKNRLSTRILRCKARRVAAFGITPHRTSSKRPGPRPRCACPSHRVGLWPLSISTPSRHDPSWTGGMPPTPPACAYPARQVTKTTRFRGEGAEVVECRAALYSCVEGDHRPRKITCHHGSRLGAILGGASRACWYAAKFASARARILRL